MGFFIILIPFVAFAVLMHVAPSIIALFTAAAICLAVIGYDIRRGRTIKMLPAGAALVFIGLGGYIALTSANLDSRTIRIIVDASLLVIALGSLVIRLPFTIQYAREQVEPDVIASPAFRNTNYILTLAWTVAFMAMLLADILAIYAPQLPLWIGFAIAFAARNSAVYFTKWYSSHRRKRFAIAQTAAASTES